MTYKKSLRLLCAALCAALLAASCDKDNDPITETRPGDEGKTVLAAPAEAPFFFEGMTDKMGDGLPDQWSFELLDSRADTFIVSGQAHEAHEGTHIRFTLPEGLPCDETYLVACAFTLHDDGEPEAYPLGYSIHIDKEGNVRLLNAFNAAAGMFGSGSEADPYIISCMADFVSMTSQMIEHDADFAGKHFALARDIDCDDTANRKINNSNGGMNPLGFDHANDRTYPFAGHLDGRGHIIKNMRLTPSGNRGYACLIHELGGEGRVDNLRMDIHITEVGQPLSITSGLVGLLSGNATISHCAVWGEIAGGNCVGGLVGLMSGGSVLSSRNHATLTPSGRGAGGIVGSIDVRSGGTYQLKGLSNNSNIIEASSRSNVTGNYGGIVGYIGYAKGAAASGTSVTLEQDSCLSLVRGRASIGGIVGGSGVPLSLKGCVQRGYIKGGTGTAFGGMIGAVETDGAVRLENCKVNGSDKTQQSFNAESNHIGGLIGWIKAPEISIKGCSMDKVNVACEALYAGGAIGSAIVTGSGAGLSISGMKIKDCHIECAGDAGGLVGNANFEPYDREDICVTIKGDNLLSVNVAAGQNTAGGLIGYARKALIEAGVKVKGSVTANNYAGGFVGYATNITIKGNGEEMTGPDVVAHTECAGGLVGFHEKASSIEGFKLAAKVGTDGGRAIRAGGLVGQARDGLTLTNCHFSGSIAGGEDTGGLVGKGLGGILRIENCTNAATVRGYSNTGGIVGVTDCGYTLKGCTNRGSVSGQRRTGGIVGYTYRKRTISSCANYGDVSGESRVGGIAGGTDADAEKERQLTIEYCRNSGKVTGDGKSVGGIAGYIFGHLHIEKTFNTGYHKGKSEVGGIVGEITGYYTMTGPTPQHIWYCYNTASSEGGEHRAGIVGWKGTDGAVGTLSVSDCYSIGSTGWGIFGGISYRPSYKYESVYYTNCGGDFSYDAVRFSPNDIGKKSVYKNFNFGGGYYGVTWVMKDHPELAGNRETAE